LGHDNEREGRKQMQQLELHLDQGQHHECQSHIGEAEPSKSGK
jgi:hypothetical protein